MSLRSYAWMLNDPARINAFRRAITAIVKPGDVVVEIGAGLGTFSFLACQAGASRVYAIEDSVFDALCEIVHKQSFGDRIKPVQGYSSDVELPEKADVIIYEDFSSAFLGAGMSKFFNDASRRFLHPGGKWLPAKAVLCGALYEASEKWEELSGWRSERNHLEGLNFSPLAGWMLNSKFRDEYSPDGIITPPRDLRRYRLGGEAETYDLSWRGEDVPDRRGNVHGICV
jgi:protein arginine N-methyltransferase 1